MSHVYWEKREIPIPAEAYINHNDGRVYLMDQNRKRTVIGHAVSETAMHPNYKFRLLYPVLWEEHYGIKESKQHELHAGMYALTLGAAYKTGVYQTMQDVYGPLYTNAMMDFSMFSMKTRTDVAMQFSEVMDTQVTFSKKAMSDTYYSELFKEKLTDEMHHSFKIEWIRKVKEKNIKKIWLSIDGSNNDCVVKESELCENGKPKSHNEAKTIVSYIYAVSAEKGWPVTYFVYEGSVVDSKAVQEVIVFLEGYGFEIEGVILDRGFYTHNVLETLREYDIDFVIMGIQDTKGCNDIMEEYAEKIYWDPQYLINEEGIFGISKEMQLWTTNEDKAILNLYFDGAGGSSQALSLIKKIWIAKMNADRICSLGRKPIIEKPLRKYISILIDESGKYTAVYNYEAWKKAIHSKGFFVIASSKDFGPSKVFDYYRLRSVSELQFKILKTHEGFDTTRVHFDSSIKSKFAICFITTILRTAIMLECKENNLDTNTMIQKMDRIIMLLIENGCYTAIRNCTTDQLTLLNAFDIQQNDFVKFANNVNSRNRNGMVSQVHTIPVHQTVEKKGRGRKAGSKNKSTLRKEAEAARLKALGIEPKEKPKGKPGRPSGSKDKQPRKKRSDAGKKRGKRKAKNDGD